jgi:signal transduction histidine kinase
MVCVYASVVTQLNGYVIGHGAGLLDQPGTQGAGLPGKLCSRSTDADFRSPRHRQVRLVPSSDYEGTGIGLSIVQRVVGRNGARVWPTAILGAAAAFTFTLSAETSP